ncbi:RCC1 domain-containing protein [Brevibacillus porteri]|uniref:Regulator n=1 Tax=Brevibacillus porteri TaxID=2126350 RepID=A0ABX5FYQ4_9BACL|nr:regulator [Brevibacillus porteri]MED1798785.1 regulator [Brevibacillus porteri]MED2131468.1 regulator [Brevibacillus porteri]MED2744022.1 regulator [Brevibacillus porteri]MED2813236.1 regulator [Brevibacillus porteri]MED2896553.1 regulator [Brevibacillus porteri]
MIRREKWVALLSYTAVLSLLTTGGVVAASPAKAGSTKVETSAGTIGNTEVKLQACSQDDTKADVSDITAKSWKSLENKPVLKGITAIATGVIFDEAGYGWRPGISYAFTEDGQVWKWGYQSDKKYEPHKLAGIKDAKQVTTDYVLTGAGDVWQIDEKKVPEKLAGLDKIKNIQQLDLHEGVLFLLKEDGTVLKWEKGAKAAEKVTKLSNIRDMYSSAFSLFAIDDQGKLLYLDGKSGELNTENLQVMDIPGKVKQIAVDYTDRALIQTEKGEMYSYNTKENEKVVRAAHADGATRMAVGGEGLYLIVKADGTVWGWGDNTLGMLGANLENELEEPVKIAGLSGMTDVQAGTDHVIALDKKGNVYSFGSNMTGQLGRIPVTFDKWTELGELRDVKQVVTELNRPYFVRKDGSVWSFGADRVPYEVKGPTKVKTLDSIMDSPVTLNENGQIQLWTSEFSSCETLALPSRIKDFVGGEEHLLLRTEDDQFLTVEFSFDSAERGGVYVITNLRPQKVETLKIDSKLAADVTKLYSNLYTFFAVTKNGQVLYAERKNDEPFTSFAQIAGLEGIRELAPEYFVRYTKDIASVWAINEAGKVQELQVYPESEGNDAGAIKVKLEPKTEEDIAMMSGRLRITKDGQIFEHEWEPLKKQKVAAPVRLISSSYDYAIEGPGSHYHVLVTEDDKIVLIGDNPYGKGELQPDMVRQ